MPLEFVAGEPLRLEWQLRPHSLQLGFQLRQRPARLRDQCVDQRTRRGAQFARVAAAVPLQQPAQRAVLQGLQRRRRQGDGMSGAAPQRIHCADGGHAVPVGRVGAGHPGGRQPGQLAGGVCAVFLSDTVGGTALGCAHDGAQPAHDGGHRQHLWCANRRRQVRGHAISGGVAGDVVEERRRQRRVRRAATVTAVGGGDHEPPAGPAHRGDEQPPLVGHHRGTGTDIAGHIVEDIEKSLGPQDAAAWNRVGPQAFL